MFSENTFKVILVTGGAGFIGSAVIRFLLKNTNSTVINFDKLTYAGNKNSLLGVENSSKYNFVEGDIVDSKALTAVIEKYRPNAVMHLAAETHVDRSIDDPSEFLRTNIMGTSVLLEVVRKYWKNLNNSDRNKFRLHHISTDEVYGSAENGEFFTEETPYDPSSPYSSSKASSDHLMRAWHRTYDLPIIITNCSNNYGPFQFPEKLIPLTILNALDGKLIPIYGNGQQVRDWIFVDDHVLGLYRVLQLGKVGETYNIGGQSERTNLDVVYEICRILDSQVTHKPKNVNSYRDFIEHVSDRPGHDQRYAISNAKIQSELGWSPKETFETGLEKTVAWYLENQEWCGNISSGNHVRDS
jgi:dTDP-glucose 4,6-dehydratase